MLFFGMVGHSMINFVAVIIFAFFICVVGIFTFIVVAVVMVFVMVIGFVGVTGGVITVSRDAFIVVVTVVTGCVSDGALGMLTGNLKQLSQLIVQVIQLG